MTGGAEAFFTGAFGLTALGGGAEPVGADLLEVADGVGTFEAVVGAGSIEVEGLAGRAGSALLTSFSLPLVDPSTFFGITILPAEADAVA